MRQPKLTVLAFGEGEDEKIFLRHLARLYCRTKVVSVQTGSAGGGDPEYILTKAIRARRGEKRDYEFILLDTDRPWPQTMTDLAREEDIELFGNEPCLEALLLEILSPPVPDIGSGRLKRDFEALCHGNFTEGECDRLFTKALISEARTRIEKLNKIVSSMEGIIIR